MLTFHILCNYISVELNSYDIITLLLICKSRIVRF